MNKNPIMDDDDAHEADVRHNNALLSMREALGGCDEFSGLLNRIVMDFGGCTISVPVAEELLDAMKDLGVLQVGGSGRCEADGDALRVLESKHRQMMHLLISYQASQKNCKWCNSGADLKMSTRALALELGYHTAAGADNVAELARSCGIKKQTVNKCCNNFQTKGGLPPRPGQRDEAARDNMTKARKGQLRNDKLSD